jgi:DsbC/DsbD-like thiol-disulfide interchange protein
MICWIVGGAFILESSLMTRLKLNLIICLAFLIAGLVAPALATNQIQLNSKPPVTIEVKTYPSKVAAGQEVWVVASILLDPDWHIYGNPKGPGPGLPTILNVTSLPEGVTADPARFLPAEKFLEPDLGADEWVWAYKKKTSIYVRLSTPGNLSSGDHQVHLLLSALLCREGLCMPYKTDLVATLTASRMLPRVKLPRHHPFPALLLSSQSRSCLSSPRRSLNCILGLFYQASK